MTVGDKIKIDVKVTNLNSFAFTAKLTKENNESALNYTIPAAFSISGKSSVVKSIYVTAATV